VNSVKTSSTIFLGDLLSEMNPMNVGDVTVTVMLLVATLIKQCSMLLDSLLAVFVTIVHITLKERTVSNVNHTSIVILIDLFMILTSVVLVNVTKEDL